MRAQWARQPGNNGRTLVLLPEDYETDQIDRRPDGAPDVRPDNPVHAQIARLEGELAGMREALAEARARASAAEASTEAAAARADDEAAKTAQAIRAFESLAERLEAMAEAQKAKTLRRWWRRIVRRG